MSRFTIAALALSVVASGGCFYPGRGGVHYTAYAVDAGIAILGASALATSRGDDLGAQLGRELAAIPIVAGAFGALINAAVAGPDDRAAD